MPDKEELYDEAIDAFADEKFDEAIELSGGVRSAVTHRPDQAARASTAGSAPAPPPAASPG